MHLINDSLIIEKNVMINIVQQNNYKKTAVRTKNVDNQLLSYTFTFKL